MTVEKPLDVDIVIVGAGLVGMSVIASLKEAGFRIVVLERQPLSSIEEAKLDQKEPVRPLSLAYGGQRCLDCWHIWPSVAPDAVPIHTLHVSEQGRLGRVCFSADEMKLPALAYVLPFSSLQRALYTAAAVQTEVTFVSIDTLSSLVRHESGITVHYVTAGRQQTLLARLLIAADGADSTCRQLLDIKIKKSQKRDLAWMITLHCDRSHHGIAYQRFTREGSLALLPLFNSHQYRLVWTLSQQRYDQITMEPDSLLLDRINEVYKGRLGNITRVQSNAVVPLQTFVAKTRVQASVVLLGNAAYTLYPVTAQGFNLSLQDVATLACVLKQAKQRGESIGALATLKRYTDYRHQNQRRVIQWTRCVSDVFRWRVPIFDPLRGIGLLGLDTLPFVKKLWARSFLHV